MISPFHIGNTGNKPAMMYFLIAFIAIFTAGGFYLVSQSSVRL